MRSLIVAAKVLLAALALSHVLTPEAQAQQPETGPTGQPRYLETPAGKKPRVVITADPELDDNNSLIRYVLHAADYTTEGLIYASSMFHWKGDDTGRTQNLPFRQYNRNGRDLCPCTSWRFAPDERFIDAVVDAYEVAYPNLKIHNPNYPTPAELRSKVRWGNVEFEGEMEKDTAGSDLIKTLLLDDLQEPIYFHAWGGQSTINRALKSIEDQYRNTPQWPAIRARVISKAVIHPSGDQDETGAKYLKVAWPEVRYGNGGGATAPLGYGAQSNAHPDDRIYYSAAWMHDNVVSRGPLGALVRTWGDGRRMVDNDIFDYFHLSGFTAEQLWARGYDVWTRPLPKGEFIGEGDTGTFLSVLDNGLEGWRQENRRSPAAYAVAASIVPRVNSINTGAPPVGAPAWVYQLRGITPQQGTATATGGRGGRGGGGGPSQPNRFLGPLMNDLAGRLAWATTPKYENANHYPVIRVKDATIAARPGEMVRMTASVDDPDGDTVSVRWWRFDNYGTYAGAVTMETSEGTTGSVRVPADARAGQTIHIVAEATDEGRPRLTRYARTVITVR